MFCGYKKHNNSTKLCLVQYENVLKQLEKQCNSNNDEEFRRKIGGDIPKLPAYDAQYRPAECLLKYMEKPPSTSVPELSVHVCFEMFVKYMVPLLSAGHALNTQNLLDKYKMFVKESDYLFDSYRAQRLKERIKHYGSKVLFTDERSNCSPSICSSSISMADVILMLLLITNKP